MAKKIEDRFVKLTDIEHVLLRPGMYIGSVKPNTSMKHIINDDKILKEEITFNPGLLKLFDEIIMNSIDESKREGSKLNIIKVDIQDGNISVYDNGGIPVEKHPKYNEWVPEMIFSNLKSGSNFDDDESREGAGTNGVGSVLANIYSSKFKVSTCDGTNKFVQTFSDNMRKRNKPSITKSKTKHTEISFTPDYEKFGLDNLDRDNYEMIKKRVYDISACNHTLKIYFNKKLINFKSFDDYIKLYKSEFFSESSKDKKWTIGVAHSTNGFQQVSFANSTETYVGGTHLDYITNQIIYKLRDFFKKKHKVDIRPNDLKNYIFLFINSTVVNPSFSSQTKEKLITEIKEFGFEFKVSDKLIKSILKSEIIESVLDWIERKKIADESKLQRDLKRKLSRIKVDKLIDAKGKERWKCSLSIFEGDSASSAFRKYRDPNTMGSFALKGKFINVSEITTRKLTENKEAVNLMAAMGISIGSEIDLKDLRYGRILIYTDADCLEEDTMVVTKNGNKKISDVDYTDEMLTHTGEYKKVNNIISKEISTYIKISVNGDEIICSEDHKLIVVRDGEVIEVKAKDLNKDDQFLIENK